MIGRRPIPRLDRGRLSSGRGAGGEPPAWSPLDISNLELWVHADHTTDGGSGTNISAVTDQGPNGAVIAEGVAGQGPTHLAASGRRSKKLISFNGSGATASTLRSVHAALVALGTGAAKDWLMAFLVQPTSTPTSYIAGWGSTTLTTRYCYARRGNASFTWEAIRRDAVNNSTVVVDSTPKGYFPQFLTIEHDAAAHTLQARVDGIAIGSPVAFPWDATVVRNAYTIGSLLASAETKTAFFRLRHHLVFSKLLSSLELQLLADWCANEIGAAGVGLRWKRGYSQSATFGTGANATRVFLIVGDSQACGREAVTPYASVNAGTPSAIFALFPDGNLDTLVSQHLVDPADVVGGMYADPGSGITDPWIRFGDRLRELGEDANIIIVNCARGGTGSVDWSASLAASPPAANTAFGAAYYRTLEALQAPNSTLELIICSGGVNAAEPPTPAASTVANIPIHWRAFIDAVYAKFSSHIVKTEWVTWARPPVTPSVSSGYSGNWAAMRQAIADFCASSPDVRMIDDPDGPFIDVDTHLGLGSNSPGAETGLMGLGVLAGDDRWAAA